LARNPGASRSTQLAGSPVVAGRISFGVLTVVFFAASVFWNDLGKPFGPGVACALAFGMFGLHMLLVGKRVSPLDPLVWIPISVLMFYFGTPVVIEWLRFPTRGGYDPWMGGNQPFMERGYCVALFSHASLLWGIYLAGVRPLERYPRRDETMDRSLGPAALLFTLGSIAMVVGGIAIVGPSTVFGIYQDWWDAKLYGGADERFIDVGTVFAYAGVFALLATDEPGARWRRYLAYGVALMVAVVTVQKGDRSGLVALGIGAGWVYSQRVARLRWAPILAAAAVTVLLMPVVAEWRAQRNLDDSQRSSPLELLGSSLANMGSSVNAITYTVELVPKEKGYYWGGTFRYAVLTAIPNVTLTKGKKFLGSNIEDTPANWITAIINPVWYSNNGGHGFAMAAEWYYNFGFPGIAIGMAFCGWIIARARNAANRSSLALIWSATLFAAMAIWVRNVLGAPFKIAVWPIIGLFVIDRVIRLLRARSSRPRTPVAASLPR